VIVFWSYKNAGMGNGIYASVPILAYTEGLHPNNKYLVETARVQIVGTTDNKVPQCWSPIEHRTSNPPQAD
jgi:hypothetical protein